MRRLRGSACRAPQKKNRIKREFRGDGDQLAAGERVLAIGLVAFNSSLCLQLALYLAHWPTESFGLLTLAQQPTPHIIAHTRLSATVADCTQMAERGRQIGYNGV